MSGLLEAHVFASFAASLVMASLLLTLRNFDALLLFVMSLPAAPFVFPLTLLIETWHEPAYMRPLRFTIGVLYLITLLITLNIRRTRWDATMSHPSRIGWLADLQRKIGDNAHLFLILAGGASVEVVLGIVVATAKSGWRGFLGALFTLCVPSGACTWMAWDHLASRQRKLQDKTQYCGICGYNLTGNVSGVCPECGREVSTTQRT